MARKIAKQRKADKRRRNDRIVSMRLMEDLILQKRFRSMVDLRQRTHGNIGMHTVQMPKFDSDLLRPGRRVIDASAGAVSLIGPNLGETTWRKPTAYLGLFWIEPRTGAKMGGGS